jgi:hypothetical protein
MDGRSGLREDKAIRFGHGFASGGDPGRIAKANQIKKAGLKARPSK